jgi:hypothetical protein
MNSTGFFKGLYTPEEIDLSGLNTREEKTLFLQKSIDAIGKFGISYLIETAHEMSAPKLSIHILYIQ